MKSESFFCVTSVTSEVLYNATTENCKNILQNIYSLMADITAQHWQKSWFNQRLQQSRIQNIRDFRLHR